MAMLIHNIPHEWITLNAAIEIKRARQLTLFWCNPNCFHFRSLLCCSDFIEHIGKEINFVWSCYHSVLLTLAAVTGYIIICSCNVNAYIGTNRRQVMEGKRSMYRLHLNEWLTYLLIGGNEMVEMKLKLTFCTSNHLHKFLYFMNCTWVSIKYLPNIALSWI